MVIVKMRFRGLISDRASVNKCWITNRKIILFVFYCKCLNPQSSKSINKLHFDNLRMAQLPDFTQICRFYRRLFGFFEKIVKVLDKPETFQVNLV